MSYIDALPKELRNLLDYYKNNIYRVILNRIYRIYAISGNDRSELERIYLNHYLTPYILPNTLYDRVFEENNRRSPDHYYYQIPNTQMISPSIFLIFYTKFRSTITIQEANRIFYEYNHPERLVDYNEHIVLALIVHE